MFLSEDGPWRAKGTNTKLCEALQGEGTHVHVQQAAEHVPRDNTVDFCEEEMILTHRGRKNNFLSRGTQMSSEHVNGP